MHPARSLKDHLLLFDFGGVLVRLGFADFYRGLGALAGISGEEAQRRYIASGIEPRMLAGNYSVHGYLTALRTTLGIGESISDESIISAYSKRIRDQDLGVDAVREKARAAGYPIGILSNIGPIDIELEQVERRFPGMFSVSGLAIFSYQHRAAKPHISLYQIINSFCEMACIRSVTFIEDNVAYAQVGAAQFGWNGIWYTANIDPAEAIRVGQEKQRTVGHIRTAGSADELSEALVSLGFEF